MQSSIEYNPFNGPGTPLEMPRNPHSLERLREIIENGQVRNHKQGIFRKPSKKTCHTCQKTFRIGCNHCRLCEEIFCNECYIYVSYSLFVTLSSGRDEPQRHSMIKLCLVGYRQLLTDFQTFNIQEGGYNHTTQTINALKNDIEKAINSYNKTVTEIRKGTKLVASRRLIDQRRYINKMLSDFDDNIYKLSPYQHHGCLGPAKYSAQFEQLKIQLDHFKNSIVDDLTYCERRAITMQLMCSHFCCCLYRCCKSPYGEYIDEDTVDYP